MQRFLRKTYAIGLKCLGFFSICFLWTCTGGPPSGPSEDGLPLIVATTGMIADGIRNIAGDRLEVRALMGPGVDPHLYKASRDDLRLFREADMIFYNGLHLEGKMAEVLGKLGREKKVVPVAEVISPERLIPVNPDEKLYDPHVWFDIPLWKQVVEEISLELQAFDPEGKEVYQGRAAQYQASLDSLDRYIREKIDSIPQERRVLITAHDAFTYFGKAYQIEVKALQGISTLSEFGLRDVLDMVNFIVDRKIKAVFVETSIPRKSLEAVVEGCREKGHEVVIGGALYSDAMGEKGSPEGTYTGMVRYNVNTIYQSLR